MLNTHLGTLKLVTRTMIGAVFAVHALSGCHSSDTQEPTANEQFQSVLDEAVKDGLPAVSVTIKGRNIDFTGSAGVSDLSTGEKIDNNDRFYIASSGKTLLAATLVQMAGEGLLDLDDPISNYLPVDITDQIPSSENMTIRMLLNHTTGIFDFQNDSDAWDNEFYFVSGPERHWSQEDVLPYFLNQPLHFEPGMDYSYSNSNYILAALVIESVTGESVDYSIRQRVIEPLGLMNTYHGNETLGLPGLVHGYYTDGLDRFDVHPWYSHFGLGDGGIQTTSEDLAIFITALITSDMILTDAMKAEMFQPSGLGTPASTYGLGINIRQIDTTGDLIFSHSGKDPGYQTEMIYIASKETVITICASGSFVDYDNLFQQLVLELFTLLEELQV